MNESDYYHPVETPGTAPPPSPPAPPAPQPLNKPGPAKHSCPHCGKAFPTKEELNLHVETAHQKPKKRR